MPWHASWCRMHQKTCTSVSGKSHLKKVLKFTIQIVSKIAIFMIFWNIFRKSLKNEIQRQFPDAFCIRKSPFSASSLSMHGFLHLFWYILKKKNSIDKGNSEFDAFRQSRCIRSFWRRMYLGSSIFKITFAYVCFSWFPDASCT